MKTPEEQLAAFLPSCEQEEADKALMLDFLKNGKTPFSRENETAHFTASAWIMSPDFERVLMIYHNIYRAWSWTGGHADGETDLFAVAKREAEEETGITGLQPADPEGGIFSLEILTVDGHEKRGKYVSSHLHYNVTYLFTADPAAPVREKPDENSGVRWIPCEDVPKVCSEPWMVERVYGKLIEKAKKNI